jgi:hypothetical protein
MLQKSTDICQYFRKSYQAYRIISILVAIFVAAHVVLKSAQALMCSDKFNKKLFIVFLSIIIITS